jgi:PIN domain nuclease of toxin-antitoxin system
MITAVADTHAALWYLAADERLSPSARDFMNETAASRREIAISAITMVEVLYLVEKTRLAPTVYEAVSKAISNPQHCFTEAPFTSAIAESMRRIPRDQVPDMPDRIVAATALYLGVPIISRDRQIRSTLLQTIW